jgi:hypothetical protein
MIIVIVLPFFVPLKMPIHEVPPAVDLFNAIDKAVDEKKPIMISMDFDPSTKGECQPMAEAAMRHTFAKNGKVIILTFLQSGLGLAKSIMENTAAEYGKKYGEDYVFLGFKYPPAQMILTMGKDIMKVFPSDNYGTSLTEMAATKHVKNFNDIGLILTISGSDMPFIWITYANAQYGAAVGIGTTAVSATQFAPFWQSHQIKGLMPGINGALTYEKLLLDRHYTKEMGRAARLAPTQSVAHVVMILFIVIGNVAFFLKKRSA